MIVLKYVCVLIRISDDVTPSEARQTPSCCGPGRWSVGGKPPPHGALHTLFLPSYNKTCSEHILSIQSLYMNQN